MRKRTILPLALIIAIQFLYSAPPKVVCVPFYPQNLAVPHDTWSGKEITLKGTAKDLDNDALVSYEWDFGDGSASVSGSITNPHVIAARHAYSGNIGDKFVARLKVTDDKGESGTGDYLVEIRDGTKLKVKVNVAIDEGLWRLHKEQVRATYGDGTPYGYWDFSSYDASATGAAVEAFEIHGHLPDGNTNEDPYVETVQRGLDYLLNQMHVYTISGAPDVNGNGIGLGCYTSSSRSMYEGGIVLMAFSSSKSPNRIAATGPANVKGRAYKDIAQDLIDYLAYGQNNDGGWRYSANYGYSDNSVSQWPAIGMEAAEVNLANDGVSVPQFVKTGLNSWINQIQCSNGGSGYTSACNWTNVAKTGGLLAEMKLVGDDKTASRVTNAINFVSNNWNSTSSDYGNLGDYYAMYGVMKGLSLLGVQTLPSGLDWYADPSKGYAQYLVSHQNDNGSWPSSIRVSHPLTTAWAVLILQLTPVEPGPIADAGPDVPSHPPIIEVSLDASGSYHFDPNKQIIEYCWDFNAEDGVDWDNPDACSNEPLITHAFPAVYNNSGEIDWGATTADYIVTLRVKDNDADDPKYDTDELTVGIKPPPWPPVAIITAPEFASKCENITLDGSASYDPNGELYPDPSHPWYSKIISYEWDLNNDGEYDDETGLQAQWSNCNEGIYVVGLKVTNSFGVSHSVDAIITVGNKPPVADAGGPYSCSGGQVTFDGSKSYDPDVGETETLQYRWDFEDDGVFDTEWDAQPTADHTYAECVEIRARLQVKDIDEAKSTDVATVLPNSPPVADAGEDKTVELASPAGTQVALDGSGSTDPDNNIVSYDWREGSAALGSGQTLDYTFPLGEHIVTLLVTDAYGEQDEDQVMIRVEDTTPPDITDISINPDVLWPPNHKMVAADVSVSVSDIGDESPVCKIVSVSSNEPVDGTGEGDTAPDWEITGDLSVDLRAERAGGGTGRVYTCIVECKDSSGNVALQSVSATVPHDKKKKK